MHDRKTQAGVWAARTGRVLLRTAINTLKAMIGIGLPVFIPILISLGIFAVTDILAPTEDVSIFFYDQTIEGPEISTEMANSSLDQYFSYLERQSISNNRWVLPSTVSKESFLGEFGEQVRLPYDVYAPTVGSESLNPDTIKGMNVAFDGYPFPIVHYGKKLNTETLLGMTRDRIFAPMTHVSGYEAAVENNVARDYYGRESLFSLNKELLLALNKGAFEAYNMEIVNPEVFIKPVPVKTNSSGEWVLDASRVDREEYGLAPVFIYKPYYTYKREFGVVADESAKQVYDKAAYSLVNDRIAAYKAQISEIESKITELIEKSKTENVDYSYDIMYMRHAIAKIEFSIDEAKKDKYRIKYEEYWYEPEVSYSAVDVETVEEIYLLDRVITFAGDYAFSYAYDQLHSDHRHANGVNYPVRTHKTYSSIDRNRVPYAYKFPDYSIPVKRFLNTQKDLFVYEPQPVGVERENLTMDYIEEYFGEFSAEISEESTNGVKLDCVILAYADEKLESEEKSIIDAFDPKISYHNAMLGYEIEQMLDTGKAYSEQIPTYKAEEVDLGFWESGFIHNRMTLEGLPKEFVYLDERYEEFTESGLPFSTAGYFRLTDTFGYRPWRGRIHYGIDVGLRSGTEIYTVDDGIVSRAEYSDGYGYVVYVDHANGVQTRYAHNDYLKVEKGDVVHKGEIIALSGNTGISTGPHLHFEVRVEGTPVDPLMFFPQLDKALK